MNKITTYISSGKFHMLKIINYEMSNHLKIPKQISTISTIISYFNSLYIMFFEKIFIHFVSTIIRT